MKRGRALRRGAHAVRKPSRRHGSPGRRSPPFWGTAFPADSGKVPLLLAAALGMRAAFKCAAVGAIHPGRCSPPCSGFARARRFPDPAAPVLGSGLSRELRQGHPASGGSRIPRDARRFQVCRRRGKLPGTEQSAFLGEQPFPQTPARPLCPRPAARRLCRAPLNPPVPM